MAHSPAILVWTATFRMKKGICFSYIQNYRPISLTAILCKVLESIIRDSVIIHMRDNELSSDKQFGFITGRSTVLQMLRVLDIWTEILDQGGSLDIIYCDFMKAFDKVPHNRLIENRKIWHYRKHLRPDEFFFTYAERRRLCFHLCWFVCLLVCLLVC